MDNNKAIIPVNTEMAVIRPVMSINDALSTYNDMVEFTKQVLKEKQDYGVIPGTNQKNTLLKPGAEKLCKFFGLSPRFRVEKEIENWEADEPFFYYRVHCTLYRMGTDTIVAEGFGSCNSREKKYRWRTADRICPNCGKTTIIKGKAEYGGGWLCWEKRGGCGAKFGDNDPAVVDQVIGVIINPDMEDLPNTILKMAKKRAFIDATLTATNASEFYTQDMEDYDFAPAGEIVDSTAEVVDEKPQTAPQEAPKLVEPVEPALSQEDHTERTALEIAQYIQGLYDDNPGAECDLTTYHTRINGLFTDDQERKSAQLFVWGRASSKDHNDAQRAAMVAYFTDPRMTKEKARQAIEKLDAAMQLEAKEAA